MKNRKKNIAAMLIGILFLFNASLSAQSSDSQGSGTTAYNSAIGLRFGTDLGLTYRTSLRSNYLEVIAGSGYRGLVVTGLYEKFIPAFNTGRFNWFYGAGGHIGIFDRPHYYNYYYYDRWGNYYVEHVYGYPGPTFGIDGIFGLEYRFPRIPFAASADLKPYLDLYRFGYGYIDGAISLRYVF
jgi:hypothetical protein